MGDYMPKSAKQAKLIASFKNLPEGDKNLVLLISDSMLQAEKSGRDRRTNSGFPALSQKPARKKPALHGDTHE